MPKPSICLVLSSVMLASCGGGEPVPGLQAALVTRSILTRCLLAPASLDEVLLGCLAGTLSIGRDAGGKECSVRFSVDRLQLTSNDYQGAIAYQRPVASHSGDTRYVYERSYAPQSGAFNFSVQAVSAGVAYFGFSFTSNADTGSGNARFGLELAPQAPGAPSVSFNCAVQI